MLTMIFNNVPTAVRDSLAQDLMDSVRADNLHTLFLMDAAPAGAPSPTAYFDVETYDFITQDTVSLRLVVGLTTTSTFEQTGVFHALNSLVDGQLWQYWERTRNKVTSTTDPALSWENIQGFLYFS
jgi:hypothetical protein